MLRRGFLADNLQYASSAPPYLAPKCLQSNLCFELGSVLGKISCYDCVKRHVRASIGKDCMSEQIILQQIAGLLDRKFSEFEVSQDKRFDAIDERFAQQDARHEQVIEALSEVVQIIVERFDRLEKRLDQIKADIIRENRVLVKQIEGKKSHRLRKNRNRIK